ncbi:MAG TPA: hypothetical protein VGT79_02770, partial [Xanthomonadaceae bacterium]|nr:hypothetical protein [Xanthomonadaceae bacterium]
VKVGQIVRVLDTIFTRTDPEIVRRFNSAAKVIRQIPGSEADVVLDTHDAVVDLLFEVRWADSYTYHAWASELELL